MRTLYIIGGSGFVGKNMVRCYYNEFNIIVVDKYIDNNFFSDYPNVDLIQLDLVDNQLPERISAPDYIINLASIVTAERDMNLFDGLISTNLKILLNLYNRFKDEKNLKLFVQFGSSEEYGNAASPFAETTREQPNSPYALVKQLTTNTTLMLQQNYGFPAMVVRPGNLFGPLQHVSKFIPYVIQSLKQNDTLNVTPCEQKRDFIHIDDFAMLVNQLIKNSNNFVGEIVNISSGKSIALKTIIEHCKAQTNSTSIINYGAMPYRENEMMDLNCDMSKFERLANTKVDIDIKIRFNELIG